MRSGQDQYGLVISFTPICSCDKHTPWPYHAACANVGKRVMTVRLQPMEPTCQPSDEKQDVLFAATGLMCWTPGVSA